MATKDRTRTTTAVGTAVISATALDNSDLLFVVDQGTDKVQVRLRDNLQLVAELGGNGVGDTQFDTPTHCAVDQYAVYVADQANDRVKKHTGTSLAYHNEFDTSTVATGGINFIHVDRKRLVIGRKDTNATVYVRLKNTPFGEEETAVDCGVHTIMGLVVLQDYFYVGLNDNTVEKRALTGGSAVATWSNSHAGYAVQSIASDNTYIYVLLVQAATDGKIVRLYKSDLLELDDFDLPAGSYQNAVDIAVDDDRLYVIDTASPSIMAINKTDGTAATGYTAQTDMTTPSGIGLFPDYWSDLPVESVAHGAGSGVITTVGTQSSTPRKQGAGSGVVSVVGTGSGKTASRGIGSGAVNVVGTGRGRLQLSTAGVGSGAVNVVGTGSGKTFAHGRGSGAVSVVGTGSGAVGAIDIGARKTVDVTHDNSGIPEVDVEVAW
jgi:hypothetical protein